MYQAAIFDLDGTLLNTIRDLANAANYALVELGLPLHSIDSYQKMIGNGKKKLIERMLPQGQEFSQTIALKLFDSYYQEHMMKETVAYNGILELLNNLRKKNVKLAVLTNKSHNYAQSIIEHYFPQLFDLVLGGDYGEKPKPDPNGLKKLMEQLHVQNDEVLYIGDSEVDIQTGHNASVATAGAAWGFREEAALSEEHPTYLVHEPAQLAEIILQ